MAAMDIFLNERSIFQTLISLLPRFDRTETFAAPSTEEEDRARRDFILEMMDEHPDAFAHEDGARAAQYYFSGRF